MEKLINRNFLMYVIIFSKISNENRFTSKSGNLFLYY